MRKYVFAVFGLILCLGLGYSCLNTNSENSVNSPYLNHAPDVTYVGKEVCKGCHPDIYATFIETGMGKSWGLANHQKSSAKFNANSLVFDSLKNLYYHPYWLGDTLQMLEFRLQGRDTIYKRTETIKYIVGSGQHTNSHIYDINGFLYQAPLTFYTQKGIWNLPPGFEDGNNTRFGRPIELECMTCHNSLPEFDVQSQNRYNKVELGLSCERCHGPGSLHVAEKQKGNILDTRKVTDFTIVNPAKLPWQLQIDVCQRCHLQGNAILKEGKSFMDFRPGMALNEIADVYMPAFSGGENKFIMASHAERLQKSKCFLNSNKINEKDNSGLKFTCITCHNPHVSVKVTGKDFFNNVCRKCHIENSCTAPLKALQLENNNCVKCHMPQSGTIDIPHVSVHDHYIRKPLAAGMKDSIQKFIGITCVNNANASAASRAEGYLNYFEKFDPEKTTCLDSAYYLLKNNNLGPDLWIHYYYLRSDYTNIIFYSIKINTNTIGDPWTNYRIAESFIKENDFISAEKWIDRTIVVKPKQMNFLLKQGYIKSNLNKTGEAKTIFETMIGYNPKYPEAWSSLGLLICNKGEGDMKKALEYYNKALQLDPDLESALINSLDIYNATGDKINFLNYLRRLYKIDPGNKKLKPMFDQFEIK